MKLTAELVQEMHEVSYSRDMAVIAQTRDDEIVVVPESTARAHGWWTITDAGRFEDWTDGRAEPGDYQEYADAINTDLELGE